MFEMIEAMNSCPSSQEFIYQIPRKLAPTLAAFAFSRRFEVQKIVEGKLSSAFINLAKNCSQKLQQSFRCSRHFFKTLHAKTQPYFLLSIDGGGVKGIIPAKILQNLEDRLGYRTGELFDGIAGTSTGSIVAAALCLKNDQMPGECKYGAKDVHEIYLKHSPKIFSSNLLQRVQSIGGLHGPRYPNEELLETAKTYLKDARLKDSNTDLAIPSMDVETRKIHLFKNLKNKPSALKKELSQIIKTACAAPTYFPAEPFYDEELGHNKILVDAGLLLQNPCYLAYKEFCKDLPKNRKIVVLSLSTGYLSSPIMSQKDAQYAGVIKWLPPILDLLMEQACDEVDQKMRIEQQYNKRLEYVRIEPQLENSAQKSTDNTAQKNLQRLTEIAQKTWQEEEEDLEKFVIKPLEEKMRSLL